MNISVVAMLKGTDGNEMAFNALRMIDAGDIISSKRKVLIKPNLTIMKSAADGITTEPSMVEGIIRFVKDNGISDIAIGEGGGCDTSEAYRRFGFVEIAKRYDVKFIDVNREISVLRPVPKPSFISDFNVSKSILDYDCIISAPKLKIHAEEWAVTLSIKNMMGTLGPGKRWKIHRDDRGVVDLLQVVKPDLAVIDGIVGGQTHELSKDPIMMNLLIASKDIVAADTVGTAVMGFSPEELPRHIKLASEAGFGVCDLDRIKIVGDVTISEVQKKFRRSGSHWGWT